MNSDLISYLSSKLYFYLQLRHHPSPEEDRFSTLCIAAAAKGYSIDTSSNYSLAQSLNMANDPQDIHVNKVL